MLAHLRHLGHGGDDRRAEVVRVGTGEPDPAKAVHRSHGAEQVCEVVGTVVQQRSKADSRLLIGRGKLQDLAIFALQEAATMIIFDQELSASQIRSITDQIDLKVIDRTQLILDIFAQRAQTREGRLQVELAQLKYLLPRLGVKDDALPRLLNPVLHL